jgi:predicted NodU family carbamoyl transferase
VNHDAAMAVLWMAVVDGSEILWAAHAERYSKIKNDHYLNQAIVDEALTYGPFDRVVYYEKPWTRNEDSSVQDNIQKCLLPKIYPHSIYDSSASQ